MQDGSRALGRPRTPSRYHTRLSKRYTTHHGSTGFPPGTTGEPSRYAGEEQGERDSESVKATSDPVGTSRIEEANGTTPFEKETFEQGHPSNRSKGKSNIETEYREHVNSGFSEYEWETERQHYNESSEDDEDTDDEQRLQDEKMALRERFAEPKKGMKGAIRTTRSEPEDQRQSEPTELMREMLKRAMSGNTTAQREVNEMMKEMLRCMHGDKKGEVPDEPEEWRPREPTKTERPTHVTPPTRPPAKPTETKKTIDMYKVNIDQLDDSSAGALQNSLYLFRDFLEQADIPEKGGDPVQDKNLKLAVNKWCKAKAPIITSLRNTFGEGGSGEERLGHVIDIFIQPKIKQRDLDPEKELAIYKYSKLYAGNGLAFHSELGRYREILARLPDDVKGSPRHWIKRVEMHAGSKILFWLDRVARGEPMYADMANDWNQFAKAMAEALDKFRQYEGEPATQPPATYAHQANGGLGGRQPEPKCSGCKGFACPKAFSNGAACDVFGSVTQARAKEILDKPPIKFWTDRKRKEAEKPAINYPQPTAQQKEALEAYDLKKASYAEKDRSKGSKGKSKGKGAKGRFGARTNSHEAPMEDSEKQDILDKGMEMLEQMRAGFGMQSHAIEPSLPGAGESVGETHSSRSCNRYSLGRANRKPMERATG